MRKCKLIAMLVTCLFVLWPAADAQAAHSQFFEFNWAFYEHMGYTDNLQLIQNSLNEFNHEDVLWMAENDCLDENGLTWCMGAGLLTPEDVWAVLVQRRISHTKPQTIWE